MVVFQEYYYFYKDGKRGGKLYYKRDYNTRIDKNRKKLKKSDGSSVEIASSNLSDVNEDEDEVINTQDEEKRIVAFEKISMCSVDLSKNDWDFTFKERNKDIKDIKCASGAVTFFKKWPPYKNSCIYVS